MHRRGLRTELIVIAERHAVGAGQLIELLRRGTYSAD